LPIEGVGPTQPFREGMVGKTAGEKRRSLSKRMRSAYRMTYNCNRNLPTHVPWLVQAVFTEHILPSVTDFYATCYWFEENEA